MANNQSDNGFVMSFFRKDRRGQDSNVTEIVKNDQFHDVPLLKFRKRNNILGDFAAFK